MTPLEFAKEMQRLFVADPSIPMWLNEVVTKQIKEQGIKPENTTQAHWETKLRTQLHPRALRHVIDLMIDGDLEMPFDQDRSMVFQVIFHQAKMRMAQRNRRLRLEANKKRMDEEKTAASVPFNRKYSASEILRRSQELRRQLDGDLIDKEEFDRLMEENQRRISEQIA